MPTKLLIVEDQPLFADALSLVIRDGMKSARIKRSDSIRGARRALCRGNRFDLVLLDLELRDTYGFDGLLHLRTLSQKVPIMVISALSEPEFARTAIICGANGFIPKSASRHAVLKAIRDVLCGGVALPDGLQLSHIPVATAELTTLAKKLNSLTPQQFNVLQLLCRGLLNEQIGRELHIRETTVKAHMTQVLRKLGVCSRTHAAAEASKLNLSNIRSFYARKDAAQNRQAFHETRDRLPHSDTSGSWRTLGTIDVKSHNREYGPSPVE